MSHSADTSETGEQAQSSVIEKVAGFAVHVAAGVLQIAAVGLVVNALYRYTVGGGFPVINEATRFALLVIVFLGLAGTHIAGGHVRVEILLSNLPIWQRRALEGFLVPIVSIFYLTLLGWAGWQATAQMFSHGTTTPTRPFIVLWPFVAVIPIGCGLLILVLVFYLLRRLAGATPGDESRSN